MSDLEAMLRNLKGRKHRYRDIKDGRVYFDHYSREEGVPEAGYSIGPNFAMETVNQSEAFLRLIREGRVYTAYYSEDGETWITVGRHESDLFPFFVGLIATGAFEHPAKADFDYFTLEQLP